MSLGRGAGMGSPNRLVLGWQINGNFEFDPNAVSEVEVRFIPEGKNQD